MNTSESETEDDSTDSARYMLQEGVKRVVRSGFVLEGDETVGLDETTYRKHSDVLVPIAGDTEDDGDEDGGEDDGDEEGEEEEDN